jgi:hypothetical protein
LFELNEVLLHLKKVLFALYRFKLCLFIIALKTQTKYNIEEKEKKWKLQFIVNENVKLLVVASLNGMKRVYKNL